ncbi:MAG: YIP1 family protein [Chlamydiales bacterium]|nr:YIP1 family protein [Chlamydiales bacterium]
MEIEPEKQMNPWVAIWFRPRKAMREILRRDEQQPTIWLALILGILNGVSSSILVWGKYAGQGFWVHVGMIASNLIIAIAIAYLYLYFISWVFQFVGAWFEGKGNTHAIRLAVGWSFYPWSVTAMLGLISAPFYAAPQAQAIIAIFYAILSIWALVIFFKLLGEAHRFSAWRSVLTVAITLAMALGVALLIAFIIMLIRL